MSEYFNDPQDFDAEARKLARRRQIAEQLVATPADAPVFMSGDMPIPNFAGAFNRFLNQTTGNREMDRLDAADALLSANQAKNTREVVEGLATKGKRTIETVDSDQGPTLPSLREVDLTPEQENQRRLKIMGSGLGNPTLRQTLMAQIGQEMDYPQQNAVRQENAAARQHQAEQSAFERRQMQDDRQAFTAQQNELYRRTAAQIGAGGGGSGSANTAPDGKPLTAAQEKAALALGSDYATLNQLKSSFKDEYAGDIRSSIERQIGKAAGGLAPQRTQDMTRWWSDQAMFDELPQRHELFGAALTPTELRSWASASISPDLSPKVIRERLATRANLYAQAEERMRANVVAGGKSGKQFDAATGKEHRLQANKDIQPVRVNSPEEAAALPSGTRYVRPDGKVAVRK